MKSGFKTGPRNWDEAKRIVTEDGATFCELWFEVEKAEVYQDMMAWFAAQGVTMGLHHWGIAPGNIKTNLMTNDPAVRDFTLHQMKQTIDIGADIQCAYVNVHPGARFLEKVDFGTREQSLLPGTETPAAEARALLLEGAQELSAYARDKGVTVTIETLPGAENPQYEHRQGWYDPGSARLADIEALAEAGNSIANDLTHTASTLMRTITDLDQVWQEVLAFTRRAAPRTRLLHLNTVVTPFDGTDSHTGLLAEDWQAGAWPSREKIVEFLSCFSDRDDVFVIPEPNRHMRENYHALQELVAGVEH